MKQGELRTMIVERYRMTTQEQADFDYELDTIDWQHDESDQLATLTGMLKLKDALTEYRKHTLHTPLDDTKGRE